MGNVWEVSMHVKTTDILPEICHGRIPFNTANMVWFLVYQGEELFAFGGLELTTTAYMGPVFVFPEHRGKGVQRYLIKERILYAKIAGYSVLTTCAYDGNVASMKNIEQCGFNFTGRVNDNEMWYSINLETYVPES